MNKLTNLLCTFVISVIPAIAAHADDSTATESRYITKSCDAAELQGEFTVDASDESFFPKGTKIKVSDAQTMSINGKPVESSEFFCLQEYDPIAKTTIFTAGHRGVINIGGCRHRYVYEDGHGRPGRDAIIFLERHIGPNSVCGKPHGPKNISGDKAPDHAHAKNGYHLGQAHAHEGNIEN